MGHEDALPRPKLSAGYGFRKETIAGMGGDGRDAPKAVTPVKATLTAAERDLVRAI
jgi:hypothetical protein